MSTDPSLARLALSADATTAAAAARRAADSPRFSAFDDGDDEQDPDRDPEQIMKRHALLCITAVSAITAGLLVTVSRAALLVHQRLARVDSVAC